MSELTSKLKAASASHSGTDLGGLLQWAALHIKEQDEALAELREGTNHHGGPGVFTGIFV